MDVKNIIDKDNNLCFKKIYENIKNSDYVIYDGLLHSNLEDSIIGSKIYLLAKLKIGIFRLSYSMSTNITQKILENNKLFIDVIKYFNKEPYWYFKYGYIILSIDKIYFFIDPVTLINYNPFDITVEYPINEVSISELIELTKKLS